ncbi:MAG: GAF domain-containing protein, partial [Gammaproteobacteria bacterium]
MKLELGDARERGLQNKNRRPGGGIASIVSRLRRLGARLLERGEREDPENGEAAALRLRHERLLEQHAALTALTKGRVFQSEDLRQAFRLLTETAARSLGVERVSVWRYSEDRSVIRCIDLYQLGPDRHSAGAELQAVLYPAYFHALASSEAIVADDAHSDPRTCEFSATYLTPLGVTAMMDIPVHVHGRLEGV